MRMAKVKKEKALNIMSRMIDCDYMIKRLTSEGKQSEIENWQQYKQDLVTLLATLQTK